jgi:hypothetical protein
LRAHGRVVGALNACGATGTTAAAVKETLSPEVATWLVGLVVTTGATATATVGAVDVTAWPLMVAVIVLLPAFVPVKAAV